MSRHRQSCLAAAIALLAAGIAFGNEPPAPVPGDVQHAVFLHEARPIFLRLHVQIDGKPFRAAWRETSERLFVYLDSDADGILGEEEAVRATDWWQRILALQPAGTNEPQDSMNPALTFANRITDGKVTREEWVKVAASIGDSLAFAAQSAVEGAGQQLWTHLDLDGDKALSAGELQAARQSLSKLDLDDDELIAADELKPYANPFARFFGQQAQRGQTMTDPQAHPLMSLSEDRCAEAAESLIARYDGRGEQQADRRLSPSEIGLDPSDFERLDNDRDGSLEAGELALLFANPPCHLALSMELGATGARQRIQQVDVDGKPALAAMAPIDREGRLTLAIGQVRLQIAATGGTAARDEVLKAQFNAADSDKNGYLDKTEARRQRLQSFDAMDRNADDKVFEDEFLTYTRQEFELVQNRALITTVDQGRVLFDAIDANRDGRLSLRELRDARERLSSGDRDGDGKLEPEEVPHQFGITIGPSPATGAGIAMPAPASPMGPTFSPVRAGPRWFQKMDRNADGDLSPREFPGTREQFARLDANGDGWIDAAEAQLTTATGKPR